MFLSCLLQIYFSLIRCTFPPLTHSLSLPLSLFHFFGSFILLIYVGIWPILCVRSATQKVVKLFWKKIKICEPFAITDKALHVFAFIYVDGECKWAAILCVRFMSVSKFWFEWLFSYFLQLPSSPLRLSRCVAKFLVLAKWKFSMERLAY